MILDCPKCKGKFALRRNCFKSEGKIDVSDFMACTQCGHLLTPLQFVGDARHGELLEWVNAYNTSEVNLNRIQRAEEQKQMANKPKSLWDVVMSDKALRMILIETKRLTETSPPPSLRIVVRSADRPTHEFLLGKFREHLQQAYQYGCVDPYIQVTAMCVAADGRYFDI